MGAEWLIVRSERPLNAETPLHLLCRSWVTPAEFFFVRNHGSIPAVDASEYRAVWPRQPPTRRLLLSAIPTATRPGRAHDRP
jgi:hypothetical protein